MELLSEIEHEDGTKLRATPVAANGRLYYMSESPTKLWAIESKTNSKISCTHTFWISVCRSGVPCSEISNYSFFLTGLAFPHLK